MGVALAVRRGARCLGQRVGAVLVRDDRIISTGYNGTPTGMKNCDEGGCRRCASRAASDQDAAVGFASGEGYDVCVCVHAEQNALLSAARFGNAVEGSTLYTTTQPCYGCFKEAVQAGIRRIVYLHPWEHPKYPEFYADLLRQFEASGGACACLQGLTDPDEAWARGRSAERSGEGKP